MSNKLNKNSERLFLERYAKNGEKKWEDLATRVSSYVANGDEYAQKEFYRIISELDFLPNSPCLMNAGTDLAQLSACFVVPIQEDSMLGIFKAIGDMAEIQKCGGGTGFNFSKIRERGAKVSTTKGQASGIVSFMRVFNASSKAVEQGGIRRGANMGVVDVDHPDFIDVITYKSEINKKIQSMTKGQDKLGADILEEAKELTYFNISANLNDKFMSQVKDYIENGVDSDWEFISRKTGKVIHTHKISYIWNTICKNAWSSGDPGIIFMDRINAYNPVPSEPMEATNPCGEQPLGAYESCNLGSINLLNHVKKTNGQYRIDYEKLENTVKTAVMFLDNVISINYFPLDEIKTHTQANRKIGLGVMGVADMLYLLNLRYGSKEALEVCKSVMAFINMRARQASSELAKIRGNFPNWESSVYCATDTPMRNATRTTIAPTGSISMLAGCSSGIEPNFSLGYKRTIRNAHDGGSYEIKVVNPVLVQVLKDRGIYSEELLDKILNNFGSLEGIDEIPSDMKDVFITSFNVTPKEHLESQAVFQKYTDNAVSKTINLPSSASVEDISNIYLKAYELGLKGTTIYRDGSLDSQVLKNVKEEKTKTKYTPVKPRPVITQSHTVKLNSGCCDMNATIGFDEKGNIFETRINNAGAGCTAMYAGLGMMVSEALRLGGDPERISNQLRQIICPACAVKSNTHGKSCPDILGKLIKAELTNSVRDFVETRKTLLPVDKPVDIVDKSSVYSICEKCGEKAYVMESGCGHCIECGYSKCKS